MIFGTSILCMYVGFHSYNVARDIVVTLMTVLLMGNVLLTFVPCSMSNEKQMCAKICYFCVTIAVCMSVALYWFFGIANDYERQHFALMVAMGFAWLGIGFYFFNSCFPESKFDNRWVHLIIPSHTLWHIFVVLNAATFYMLVFHFVKYIEDTDRASN